MTSIIFSVCIFALVLVMTKTASADENYSTEIADEIKTFLIDDDWNFDFDEDKGVFRFGVNVDGKMKHVNYFVPVRDDGYTVYAVSPISADTDEPENIAAMAEFVCRANYGLRNGNFELDVTDGEIRYKVFVDCDNLIPSKEVVRDSIIIPAMMFERYAPGILDVIFKGVSAEDAIEKCED